MKISFTREELKQIGEAGNEIGKVMVALGVPDHIATEININDHVTNVSGKWGYVYCTEETVAIFVEPEMVKDTASLFMNILQPAMAIVVKYKERIVSIVESVKPLYKLIVEPFLKDIDKELSSNEVMMDKVHAFEEKWIDEDEVDSNIG